MLTLEAFDPLAIATRLAIQDGQVATLAQLLAENPELAAARIADPRGCDPPGAARSLLHVATDWPGHYPNGPQVVAVLIESGADVNARFGLGRGETPLHWAASSDDVEVLEVLLAHGADIEADGAVIGGGTALADATAFGQWNAARKLIERGAQTTLWQAAALGLLDRVEQCFTESRPTAEDITNAFWCACHGSQLSTAEYLLERGAELNWIGHDQLAPLDAARRSGARELSEWLVARGAKSANPAG